jgi:hypothetical protein
MTGPYVQNNNGIVFGGGQVSGGAFAAGNGASATYHAGADTSLEAVRLLDELVALVERHRAALPGADQVRRDADEVRAELARDGQPDRDRVTAALTRIGARVTAVGAVAAAAQQLQTVVGQLLQ